MDADIKNLYFALRHMFPMLTASAAWKIAQSSIALRPRLHWLVYSTTNKNGDR